MLVERRAYNRDQSYEVFQVLEREQDDNFPRRVRCWLPVPESEPGTFCLLPGAPTRSDLKYWRGQGSAWGAVEFERIEGPGSPRVKLKDAPARAAVLASPFAKKR